MSHPNRRRIAKDVKARMIAYFANHSVQEVAAEFGVHFTTVYRLINNKRHRKILKAFVREDMMVSNTDKSTRVKDRT